MNNKRRQKLDTCKWMLGSISAEAQGISTQLEDILKLKDKLDGWSQVTNRTLDRLNAILKEENDALNAIPDNFQFGDTSFNIENSLVDIETAIDETKKILDFIDTVEEEFNALPLRVIDYSEFIEALNELDNGVDSAQDSILDAKGFWGC